MIRTIKREVERFAKKIDVEKDKLISIKNKNYSKYLPQVANEKNAEAEEQYKIITDPIRQRAKITVNDIIVRAENYISHSVAVVDVDALNELRALKGIELDNVEFETLQMNYRGKYWPLRILSDMYQKKEITAESILHNHEIKRPDPTAYNELFQELRITTERFIENYDNNLIMGSVNPEDVWFETLLRGDYFEKLEERINAINPAYFNAEYPVITNTDEEKERLEELFGGKSKAVILETIKSLYKNKRLEEDTELFGIVSRSKYKIYLRELMLADGLPVYF